MHTERAPTCVFPRCHPVVVLRALLGAAMVVVCGAAAQAQVTIVHDTFAGATLTNHQPDTNLPSSAWSVTGSGATLWNHFAWAAGADWSGILATINTGVSDGTIAVDWTPGGDTPYGAIVARATDAANYLIAYYWAGALYLYRIGSSGNVLLASTAIDAPGTATHRLKMVLAGTSIQVSYDGALRLSATDGFNIAATRHGFRWLSYYDWQSVYSNFQVDGVFVPTAATTSVTPVSPQVPLFRSVTLMATAYDAANHVIPAMSFSWTTSNGAAVSVASLGGNTASATGIGAGSATITATPLSGAGSTATVTVNTGPVALYDTFVGADSTSLTSHVPEVNIPGGAWSTNGSGAVLSGHRAAAGGADWDPITATIDSGMADGIVEVDWTPGGLETPAATIVARMTNADNYLLAHYWADSLWLYRVANDRYTLLGQAAVADAGTATHHLALKVAGAALEVWWDGVQEIVASDAFNSTATRHGFRWYSWWDWLSTYDRFEVSALPTIASVTVTPATVAIPMNGGRMLTAQAFDGAGDPIPGVSFTWQSSNASVVSTRVASATMGAAIAEGVGNATITATAFGGSAQQTAAVTVTAPPPPPPPSSPGCASGVFPASVTWPADGGIGQLTLSAPSNCEWSAEWSAPWITPLQTSGMGDASVSYAIDRNDSGVARSGSLTVAGVTFSINQTAVFTGNASTGSAGGASSGSGGTGPACTAAVTPPYVHAVPSGGDGLIQLAIAEQCSWTVSMSESWIHVTPTSGTGAAILSIWVDVGDSHTRFGQITFSSGATVSIAQSENFGPAVRMLPPDSSGPIGRLRNDDEPLEANPGHCDGDEENCEPGVVITFPIGDPTEPTDATPSSIHVRCRLVTHPAGNAAGGLHCYIVTKLGNPLLQGFLVTQTVEGRREQTEFLDRLVVDVYSGENGTATSLNSPLDPEVWTFNDQAVRNDIACILATGKKIDQMHFPYSAGGPNSNSVVHTIMNVCKRPVQLPPAAVGATVPLGPIR